MKIRYYAEKIKNTPLPLLIKKLKRKIFFLIWNRYIKYEDRLIATYERNHRAYKLNSYIALSPELDFTQDDIDLIDKLSALYLSHYYDLLGSGWVKNDGDYNIPVNKSNRGESKKILGLIDKD